MRCFFRAALASLLCATSCRSSAPSVDASIDPPPTPTTSVSVASRSRVPPTIQAVFTPPNPSVGQATILSVTLRASSLDPNVHVWIEHDHECAIADVKSAWTKGAMKDLKHPTSLASAFRDPFDVSGAPLEIDISMIAKKRGECTVQLGTKIEAVATTNVTSATLLVLD